MKERTRLLGTRVRERLSVLQEPNVRWLASGTFFNAVGNNIYGVALGWLAYEATGSALAVGVVVGARSLPLLFVGPFAGAITDRMHRPRVLKGYAFYYTFVSFAFTVLLFSADVTVTHMTIYMLLVGVGFAFGPTARRAIYADSVSRRHLVGALAMDSSLLELGHLLMPAVVGIVLAEYGAGAAFTIQTVSYLTMTLLILRVNTPFMAKSQSVKTPLWHSVGEGLRYANETPPVRRMLTVTAIVTLVGADFVYFLVPVISGDLLDAGAKGVGLILMGGAAGGLIGPFILIGVRGMISSATLMSANLLCMGFGMVAIVLSPSLAVAVTIYGVITGTQIVYRTMATGYLNLAVPVEFRGRITSLDQLMRGIRTSGAFIAGGTAELVGLRAAIFVAGVVIVVTGAATARAFRGTQVDGW